MPKQKKTTKRISNDAHGKVNAAGAIIFGGAAVGYIGYLQPEESLKLVLIGFGCALALIGAVLLGMAISPAKK